MEAFYSRIPKDLYELARAAQGAGLPLYAVGGFVRDRLLGLECSDIDLTGPATPAELCAFLSEQGVGYTTGAERLGTVLIKLASGTCEYTAFRTESYGSGGEHSPKATCFTRELEVDARRRDFSVNALYFALAEGRLIDPVGGLPDLERRVLRTTSPNPNDILEDDGLRLMRLVRFAVQLGFTVEDKTYNAARENASRLGDISPERKRDELSRILVAEDVLPALHMLRDLGLLPYLVPELVPCDGLKQAHAYHLYDVLEHSFRVTALLPPTLRLRLAGLLHDCSKGHTSKWKYHDKESAVLAKAALERLRYSNDMVRGVCELIANHMFALDRDNLSDAELRLGLAERGRELSRELIAFRRADVGGCGGNQAEGSAVRMEQMLNAMEAEGVPFDPRELDIDGAVLMRELGLEPSPELGRIKAALHRHCVLHPKDNRRDRLLESARGLFTAE